MTLQTLADRLGVSRTTASNAFNRPDQLNPALRERVLALAAELGYAGPDPAGRALRSGRAGAIGVLLTEQLSYAFDDPAAVATLRGLAAEAERVGISLALLPAPLSGGGPPAARSTRALVDACFVYALPEDHPSVARRARAQLPVVVSDTPHIDGVPFVSIDDRGGARAAAQHLLDLGHRRLAVVSLRHARRRPQRLRRRRAPPRPRPTASRASASRATRTRSPAPASTGTTCRSTRSTRTRARSAREAVARAARARAAADRVLAMSDEIALGVIDGARAPALDVPRELSVVGFDDVAGRRRAG